VDMVKFEKIFARNPSPRRSIQMKAFKEKYFEASRTFSAHQEAILKRKAEVEANERVQQKKEETLPPPPLRMEETLPEDVRAGMRLSIREGREAVARLESRSGDANDTFRSVVGYIRDDVTASLHLSARSACWRS
ncbi:Hypothetical protein FKW44_000628, partial [Caligus rogercresseyi]